MIHAVNIVAAVLALGLAMLAGVDWSAREAERAPRELGAAADVRWVELPDGKRGLRDASGTVVPVGEFERIVAGSKIADSLLLELASPERVVGFSHHSERESPLGTYRFAGKPHLDPLNELERLLALKPDLVLLNTHGSPAQVARLREAGVSVFNLGEMRGLDSYLANVRVVAALLGVEERGVRYARQFAGRMQRVAVGVASEDEKTAIYVAIFGGKMFGGGRNTSYDDVLTHAGLVNAAAARYQGWPEYVAEQILEMNPDYLVTQEGMGDSLCNHPGLDQLDACNAGRLIELPAAMIGDAGAGMLPATEEIHRLVFSGGRN